MLLFNEIINIFSKYFSYNYILSETNDRVNMSAENKKSKTIEINRWDHKGVDALENICRSTDTYRIADINELVTSLRITGRIKLSFDRSRLSGYIYMRKCHFKFLHNNTPNALFSFLPCSDFDIDETVNFDTPIQLNDYRNFILTNFDDKINGIEMNLTFTYTYENVIEILENKVDKLEKERNINTYKIAALEDKIQVLSEMITKLQN